MRRIPDACAELQKLAFGVRNAVHGMRHLAVVIGVTSVDTSGNSMCNRAINRRSPERTIVRTRCHTIIDAGVPCYSRQFECTVYTVEVKGLADD